VQDDLRQRLVRTRWPDEAPASGRAYGTSLACLQELVTYWHASFDWHQHIVRVYERYHGSAAALTHRRADRDRFAERFPGLLDRVSFTVLGTPSAALHSALNDPGAPSLAPFAGFERGRPATPIAGSKRPTRSDTMC
jgi:hypothetical protein